MNGYDRLDFAARRKGWTIEQNRRPGWGTWSRIFTSVDIIIEVWFNGYVVHSALMLRRETEYRLGPKDRDKAGRIESVLLNNEPYPNWPILSKGTRNES